MIEWISVHVKTRLVSAHFELILKFVIIFSTSYCRSRRSARDYAVRVGSTDNTFGGSVIRVQQFIRHELYRRRTIDYDVSLAQLATTVNYNNQIQPIALPNIDSVFADNTTCLASGWGNLTIMEKRKEKEIHGTF